ELNTRIALRSGIVTEYFPSTSVTVPDEVPFIRTFTPGIPSLSAEEITLPVMTVDSWSEAAANSGIVQANPSKITDRQTSLILFLIRLCRFLFIVSGVLNY